MDPDPSSTPFDPLGPELDARLREIVHAAAEEAEAARRDVEGRRRAAVAETERYVESARRRVDADAAERGRRLERLGIEIDTLSRALQRPLDELARAVRDAAAELGAPPATTPEPPWSEGAPAPAPAGPPTEAPTLERSPPQPAPVAAPEPSPTPEGGGDGAPPEPTPEPPAPPAPPATPPAPPTATPAPTAGPGAARLLAIEMAVDGATRAEVADRLRERFGLETPAELLDGVFGADTEGSSRLRWGSP